MHELTPSPQRETLVVVEFKQRGLAYSRLLQFLEFLVQHALRKLDAFLKEHSPHVSPLQYIFDIDVLSDFDGHMRYASARRVFGSPLRGFVLDVGGGEGQHFTQVFGERVIETVALNIRLDSLLHSRDFATHNMLGDGCHLPFRNHVFSLSLAMAVIHQVPGSKRKELLSEMQRVSKSVVVQEECIQQVALTDRVGYWVNLMTGQRTHSNDQRQLDAKTRALMRALNENLKNAEIRGNRNFAVWLWTTWLLSRTPFLRLLLGVLYYTILKRFDRRAPFYGVLAISSCGSVVHHSIEESRTIANGG